MKIDTCSPNKNKSYTQPYQKHIDCSYGYKVVCCYPYMGRFIGTTASKAKEYYAIVYPKYSSPGKVFMRLLNWIIQHTKMRGFRVFMHDTKRINEIIESHGFKRIFYDKTFIWEILVFERKN